MIISSFDEETLADAKLELEKLKLERRNLDEQITAANSAASPRLDADSADVIVSRLVEKSAKIFGELHSMPNHLVREWLSVVVPKVVVDMKNKAIEIHVALPSSFLKGEFLSERAMRLERSSASPSGYETHPAAGQILIALIDCKFRKAANQICCTCLRQSAA